MNSNKTILILTVILGIFFISGCGSEDMMPIHSFTSDSYTVDIMTPGGTLESGDNSVSIRVLSRGVSVEVSGAELMFSMPAMGNMPYMEMQTIFTETQQTGELNGKLNFPMGGSWTGHFQLFAGEDPISATFSIRVDD